MIHYNYSRRQLEQKAEELLREFDTERLIKPKPLDVYSVIEKCLDVPYDWKYLTPDGSILGLTAFKSGYIWAWPAPYYEDGMRPFKIFLSENTIVIDSSLTESQNRGRENFTVIHEVFHQKLHKKCFMHCNPDYSHATTKKALTLTPNKRAYSSLEINEIQANYCAACFLMPQNALEQTALKFFGSKKPHLDNPQISNLIKDLSDIFNVSVAAMKIRLSALGLAY